MSGSGGRVGSIGNPIGPRVTVLSVTFWIGGIVGVIVVVKRVTISVSC